MMNYKLKWNICSIILTMITTGATGIGVNIGRIADDLPTPAAMAALVQSQGIDHVKIYDADAETLRAFAGSKVEMAIMVPNEIIAQIASSSSAAAAWVAANVSSFSSRITTIMVGNEVLTRADPSLAPLLLPAMKNIRAALVTSGSSAAVTTPHAFDILDPSSSFPPSSGVFKESLRPLLVAMADELNATSSPFMVDVYPYFAYRDDSKDVPLDYALFSQTAAGVDDPASRLHYSNLFDAQVDAIVAALNKLSPAASSLPIVVSETGWPSAGDQDEVGATLENAITYNERLIDHVSKSPPQGTPLRPGIGLEVYIFELFNENQKTGSGSERNFGLFYPNMSKVGGGGTSLSPVIPNTTHQSTPGTGSRGISSNWSNCGSDISPAFFVGLIFFILRM